MLSYGVSFILYRLFFFIWSLKNRSTRIHMRAVALSYNTDGIGMRVRAHVYINTYIHDFYL